MTDTVLQQHVEQVRSLLEDLNTEIEQANELGIEFIFEMYKQRLAIDKISIRPYAKIPERVNEADVGF